MTTRKARLEKVFAAFYPAQKRGAVMWFVEQVEVCSRVRVSQSAIYRWFDGEHVVGGDDLEALLQELEGDAILCRLDRAQAEIDDIKGGLR